MKPVLEFARSAASGPVVEDEPRDRSAERLTRVLVDALEPSPARRLARA
jgi:hypothetical protein